MSNPPELLAADPARQATASLGGYVYQVWHSLLAWLLLREDEALVLEGNEDYDRLAPGQAMTTQIKRLDTERRLTLRSPEVIGAMNNFWAARGRNPGVELQYRFLCTCGAGQEAGRPLSGGKGLDVWRQARLRQDVSQDLRAAREIRDFLAEAVSVSIELGNWLASASAECVLEALIRPVNWDLGTGGMPEVRRLVEDRLIVMGERYGMLPTECRGAAANLLDEVFSCAASKDRRVLTRSLLLQSFERLTTMPVSKGSYRLMSAQHADAGRQSLGAIGAVTPPIAAGQPVMPAVPLPRAGLVAVAAVAARSGFCYLHGSTGMGKSTAALMLVSESYPPPLWLDLRSDPAGAPSAIRQATATIMRPGGACGLVLDDLCFEGDSRPLQDAVARAMAAATTAGAFVIATGAGEMPAALTLRLGLPAGSSVRVPALNEGEIEELLALHGAGDNRTAWAGLVRAHTSGHPQLVDAMVQGLRRRGFPDPGPDDLVSRPHEIIELQDQARRLLGTMPPSQRSLLHRLSLNTLPFRRAAAMRIAGLPRPIAEAGDQFDALVGPWIERVGLTRFRVSPLAADAGSHTNGPEWAEKTHAAAADVLLQGSVDHFDLQSACLHAIKGRNARALIRLSRTFVVDARELKPAAAMLAWFIHVDPAVAGMKLTTQELAAVKLAQFEIAANLGGKDAVPIAHALDALSRPKPDASLMENRLRAAALSKVLVRVDVRMGPRWVVEAIVELSVICSRHPELGIDVACGTAVDPLAVGAPYHLKAMLPVFLPGRLRSPSDLREFWESLDAQPSEVRTDLLTAYVIDPASAGLVTDEVWLALMRSDSPDWHDLLDALHRGFDLALSWASLSFATATAVAIVRVLNENLRRHREAFSFGRKAIRITGSAPSLLDALADVCDWTGRPGASLHLRDRALSRWNVGRFDRIGPALVGRKAAIAAAERGAWRTAADRLRAAALSLPPDTAHDVLRAGLIADAGHALARAKEDRAAAADLWAAFKILRRIPNVPDRTREFRLHKLFGNLVTWLVRGSLVDEDGLGIREPPAAACSNFDVPSDIADLDATPLELVALQVIRYGGPAVRDEPEAEDAIVEARRSRYAVIRVEAHAVEAEVAVARGDTRGIVAHATAHAREMLSFYAHRETAAPLGYDLPPSSKSITAPDAGFLVLRPVMSCLLVQACGGGPAAPPTGWLDTPEMAFLAEETRAELWEIDELFAKRPAERWEAYRRNRDDPKPFKPLARAVVLATDAPEQSTWLLHAHVALFQGFVHKRLAPEAAPATCRLVAAQWSALAEQPFRLIAPRISVPALRTSLALPDDGLPRMGAILTAAFFATGTRLPGWLALLLSGQQAQAPEIN